TGRLRDGRFTRPDEVADLVLFLAKRHRAAHIAPTQALGYEWPSRALPAGVLARDGCCVDEQQRIERVLRGDVLDEGVRFALRIHRPNLTRPSWLVEPHWRVAQIERKERNAGGSQGAVECLSFGRRHGETLQTTAASCHGLERSLVERK